MSDARDPRARGRRRFLEFLAASPLLMGLAPLQRLQAAEELVQGLISAPEEALNVFDFEAVARQRLAPAHYGYLASGSAGDETLRANREGFDLYRIRARRLAGIERVDTSVELFGTRWETPIGLAPVSSQLAFHPGGELASARASEAYLQILSNMSSTSYERVAAARGTPTWFQLYPFGEWRITRALLERAEDAGAPVVVLTVDRAAPRRLETYERWRRRDRRDCEQCHTPGNPLAGKPMFDGIDLGDPERLRATGLTWEIVERLKESTSMKVVVKGIVTAGDAERCVRHGADGLIVSNHGGRAEASGRSTIESLPEVVAAVNGRMPVLVDGGFRRGADIFKALALGATAVCIGRPYVWGLAAFGEPGVQAVLRMLTAELTRIMGEAGAGDPAELGSSFVEPAARLRMERGASVNSRRGR